MIGRAWEPPSHLARARVKKYPFPLPPRHAAGRQREDRRCRLPPAKKGGRPTANQRPPQQATGWHAIPAAVLPTPAPDISSRLRPGQRVLCSALLLLSLHCPPALAVWRSMGPSRNLASALPLLASPPCHRAKREQPLVGVLLAGISQCVSLRQLIHLLEALVAEPACCQPRAIGCVRHRHTSPSRLPRILPSSLATAVHVAPATYVCSSMYVVCM